MDLISKKSGQPWRFCLVFTIRIYIYVDEDMLGFPTASAAHFRSTISSFSNPYSYLHVAFGSALTVSVHDGCPLEPEAPLLDGPICNKGKVITIPEMNYHGQKFTTFEQTHLQDGPIIML